MRYRARHEPTRIVYMIGTRWRTRMARTLAKDADGWIEGECVASGFDPLRARDWQIAAALAR